MGTFQRAEGDNLNRECLTSAVEDPAPESVLSKVEVFEPNFKMLRFFK